LRQLDSAVCDLALLDLGVPDGDSLALIRAGRRTLPVLALNARDSLGYRRGAARRRPSLKFPLRP